MARKKKTSEEGCPVIIEDEDGRNIVQEEQGKEIQYTRDYGVGLDVHSQFIQISVLVKNKLSVYEFRRSFDTDWISVNEAKNWITETIRTNSDPVIDASANLHYTLESTSSYHTVITTAWGGIPSIVNPVLARAGSKKTDVWDARTLATSDLTGVWPASYIPSIEAVELRMLVDERTQCMQRATQISNRINNSLLKLGINIGREGSVAKNTQLRETVHSVIFGESKDIIKNPEYPDPPSVPADIRCIFEKDYAVFDEYCVLANDYEERALEKIDSMMWETASGEIPGKEMMKILTTAPGVGTQTAILWLSRVITPRRFPSEKALAAYCGCDPSLKVSAGKVTSTVKRGGRKDLHSALCMAASNLMRRHSEPFGKFGYNIAMQTGIWKKGVNAVARKLCVAMYFMMLRGETFSYAKYKMITEPDVLVIPVETLVVLNPSFKRYLRFMLQNDIHDTQQLVHKYYICELPSIKGFGKNFFCLVKDFINDQAKYRELYERMSANENNKSKE